MSMEYYTISLLLPIISLIPIILTILFTSKVTTKSNLPPGPKPWPIIGSIHKLGDKPHHVVAKLSKIYGPIMSLKLGSITTIVISSPEIAKEMFLEHDLALSSRPMQTKSLKKFSMVWLPVCPKWRHLQKITTLQLFTTQRLDISQVLRHTKVKELMEYAQQCCENHVPVDIGKAAFTTSLNLLSNTIFSMDLASHVSSNSQEFKDIVWNIMESRPNVLDYIPLVRKLDLQGVLRRKRSYFKKMMGVFEEIIDVRLKDPMDVKDDVLGTLLKLVKDEELSLHDVKHMLFDLFLAGTDTTSSTLEWAMTELLRNPKVMEKAQIEIDQVLGKDGSMQELDIAKLPYIQAIEKETLRMHPPAPFLIPHMAIEDVQLCGYLVPKQSTIWVNVWSIDRDPSVWEKPKMFSPERFLEKEIDVKGRNFELIPFGSGRRICPGMPLAYRMLHLTLATLLHSFNWKYINEASIATCTIDLEEKFGITLQKAEPLQAIPLPRRLMEVH